MQRKHCVLEWEENVKYQLNHMLLEIKSSCVSRKNNKRIMRPEDYGWCGNSSKTGEKILATKAIQKAIDAATRQGGGTVLLGNGDYVSGTIQLRSNVTLMIDENARLLGSVNINDYEEHIAKRKTVMDTHMGMNQSLIFAEECENIAICGKGIIDGRGTKENFPGDETVCETPGRPFLMRIIDCKNVSIEDISLKDAACWMQNYLNCENMLLKNIHVENQANYNNDGIDVDGCRNVLIRDCFVSSGDDAMCFKGASQKSTENVLIENCVFLSSCNAIKIGTDTQGDFRNIYIRDCKIGGITDDMRHIKKLGADSGISLEMVDGGTLENIWIQRIVMSHARTPFFIRLDDRGRVKPEDAKPKIGIIRNIVLELINGIDCGPQGSYFLGYVEKCIENILLRNITIYQRVSMKPITHDYDFEEMNKWYPDAQMIKGVGDAPAYGLWVRHGKNIILDRYKVIPKGNERRPQIVAINDTEIMEVQYEE